MSKLKAGDPFPHLQVKLLDDSEVVLGRPLGGLPWQAIFVYRGKHCPLCTKFVYRGKHCPLCTKFVYRGKHCPLCTKYLNELETFKTAFTDGGIEILAVSSDSKAQLQEHLKSLSISFPIAYGLSQEQMQQLGLYISPPRSEQETDHNFSEPGLFVVNEKGNLHVVDLSNNPFVRPELGALSHGLAWIRDSDNNYPIRGTFDY